MTHFEIVLVIINALFMLCYMFSTLSKEPTIASQNKALKTLIKNWFSESNKYDLCNQLLPETTEAMADQLKKEVENYFTGERMEVFWRSFKSDLVNRSIEAAKDNIARDIDKEVIEEIKRTRINEILKLVDTQAIASAVSLKASAAILQLVPDNQQHYDQYGNIIQVHDSQGRLR